MTALPSIYQPSDFAGLEPTPGNIAVSVLNTNLNTMSTVNGGGVLQLGAAAYAMSAKTVVMKDKTTIRGVGAGRTVLDFSAIATFASSTGMITASGAGPGTFYSVTGSPAVGDRTITGVGGTLPGPFQPGAHVTIRSTEFNQPHLYDIPHSVWTSSTARAAGDIVLINGVWVVYSIAGVSGGSAPSTGSSPITDGTATAYAFPWTDRTYQQRWAVSTAYTPGQIRVTSAGLIYVCVVAGTSSGSEPIITTSAAFGGGGTLMWRYAGYYNATKGEILRNAVVGTSGTSVELTTELLMSYPTSYPSGATFTVEMAVVTLAEIALEDLTVRGRGISGLSLSGPDSHGTYSAPGADIGLQVDWCIVRLRGVTFEGVEQFAVHRRSSFVHGEDTVAFVNSPTRIESQQYGVFAQGAGFDTFEHVEGYNCRHIWDGDGSTSLTSQYRGVPQGVTVQSSYGQGLWQGPIAGHRDCLDIQVSNAVWHVLSSAIECRAQRASFSNITAYGPRSTFIYQDPMIAFFYFGGEAKLSNVRVYGGYAGLWVYDSDTFTSQADISGDVYFNGVNQQSVRLGANGYDYASRITLSVQSVSPGSDHVLLDCTLDQVSFPSLDLTGGVNGVTNNNRKSPITYLNVGQVRAKGLSGKGFDLYNVTAGRLGGGIINSTTTAAINVISDCKELVIGEHVLECRSAFADHGWSIRATSAGASDRISMGPQVVKTPSPGAATALSVETNVTNSKFGYVTSEAPTVVNPGSGTTNRFDNAVTQSVTIASGVVTAGLGVPLIYVAGQGGAADDLDTINYAGEIGDRIQLRRNSVIITAKDNTGNLRLGADRILNHDTDILGLEWIGGVWVETFFANNG